jgi:hypothetical protein
MLGVLATLQAASFLSSLRKLKELENRGTDFVEINTGEF